MRLWFRLGRLRIGKGGVNEPSRVTVRPPAPAPLYRRTEVANSVGETTGAEPRRLSMFAYANGHTLWLYKSERTVEHCCRPGFFNSMGSTMTSGDFVHLVCVDGGALRFVALADVTVVTLEPLK